MDHHAPNPDPQLRQAIASATLDLASRRGYPMVSVAEIAAAVGVSKRTFHGVFAHKDAVIVSIFETIVSAVCDEMKPHPNPQEVLFMATTKVLGDIADGCGVVSVPHLTAATVVVTKSPHLQRQISAMRRQRMPAALAAHLGVEAADPCVQGAVRLWSAVVAACYQTDIGAGAEVRSRLDTTTPHRMSQRLEHTYRFVIGDAGGSGESPEEVVPRPA
ncbi:TetR/AcrR family transcriptional regulator [Mycolicibacterium komossense]|uniref:TetR/AcrR family transcriptional regulator n=2 Tax=Mycolicibacterium komossense TaxID=1779 RepID=A0ABT3CKV3_9MYCO|nr:TetR/AcrR family transcriptional regulator [Mycolicibacterium komossense]